MSRSVTQNSSGFSSAVTNGSTVIQQVTTTTGFSAGDYVYTTPTGIGTRTTGNVSIGADTPYVGTTWITTGIQSVNFRAASLGPLIDQGTYSGTTRTMGGVTTASSTIVALGSTNFHRSCTLLNGNIVQMYSVGANLYFRIVDVSGNIVVAQTTLSSTLFTSSNVGGFACCTLTSGNIQFIFQNGTTNQVTTSQYNPTGGQVVAPGNKSSGVSQFGNISMAALSGGGSVALGSSGYTATMGTPRIIIFDSTGSVNDIVNGSYSSGQSKYMPVVGLPASYGTNIWGYYCQDSVNGAGSYAQLAMYTNGTAMFSFTNTYSTMNSGGGGVFNMTFTTDGYILAISYFGGPYYFKALYTKTTNTSGSITSIANGSIGNGNSAFVSALPNGGVSCVAMTNGGDAYINSATSSMAFNSQVQVTGAPISVSNAQDGFFAATTASGVAVMNYSAITTNYPSSIIAAVIPATNGVTSLTGNTYLPSAGYYLMGVAATDAAANGTGEVIVNGTAQLGSTYPSASTPIYYSFQANANQPIFGQRGSVTATTVTLKGLEV